MRASTQKPNSQKKTIPKLAAPDSKLAAPDPKLAAPAPKLAAPVSKLAAPAPKLAAPVSKLAAPAPRQQKAFICQNEMYINRTTKQMIYGIIIRELGSKVVMNFDRKTDTYVDIDLDLVEKLNPEALQRVYNIVRSAREALNRPASGQAPLLSDMLHSEKIVP